MYISELKLHGFKSFAKKEILKFGEGITVLVGPNGCGKTNIVDAVRWVLGEQKYSLLRSSKMEDIIFNGSTSHKPINVCEVSLTVHNKGKLPIDYTEVEITRRIYRNGESSYMINRSSCRLKDIQDLFMDTGMGADAYSVIELKMIEDILSETADDRRRMFEEAAGINRYKKQRKTAIRKFEATRADLNRVHDIITEVETKVNGLRLQLKRFDRHAVLSEQIKQRELELAYIQKQRIEKKLGPLSEQITTLHHQRSQNKDQEKGQEDALEHLQKSYREQQEKLTKLKIHIDELLGHRQDCNNKLLIMNEQIRSSERTIERFELEKDECENQIESYRFQIKEYQVELKSFDPRIKSKISEYTSRRQDFEKINNTFKETEERLEYLTGRQFEHLQKLNSARSLLDRTKHLYDEKMTRIGVLRVKITELEQGLKEDKLKQKDLEKIRSTHEKTISKSRSLLDELDKNINDLRSQKHNLSLDFHRIANQVESLESKLQFYNEIVETNEGYPSGVRHILTQLNNYPGIEGTVADLIMVDDKYRSAIEAGLGTLSQCLVCKSRKVALSTMKKLSKENMGSVSFIPMDSINFQKIEIKKVAKKGDGILQAIDLVKTKKSMEPLIQFLLKDLVIVEDMESAELLWQSKEFTGNIADLSGRFYSNTGIITSINGQSGISILGRLEKIQELDSAIEKLVKKGNDIKNKTAEVEKLLRTSEEKHAESSQNLGNQIDLFAEVEKKITQNEFSISRIVELLQSVTHESVAVKQDLLNVQGSLDQLTPKLTDLEEQQETYSNKIIEAKKNRDIVKDQRDKENEMIQDMRFELINLENDRDNLQYKIERMEENINELNKRGGDLSEKKTILQSEIIILEKDIKVLKKELGKHTARYKKELAILDLKDQAFSEVYQQIESQQREIREEQRKRERLTEDLKRCELQSADLVRQIEFVQHRLQEKYDLDIPRSMDIQLSEDKLLLQIDRIERSIERIGPINMAVKREYEEESQRLDFLQKQRDDLLESEKSLMETIYHIDRKARKQFTDTFKKIRRNFQNTFKLFFEGGEGDLELQGDDDPLESNISISARPPGKRTHNLRLLSAGEKALTAIALLFAIYQVKPSPFCILDEVDAPLDDNNINKFTRVLNKFSEDTQFIIVTHNKLTMEAADYLYGVTMEKSGVSKIVSVKFE
ncbi:MAG: chromosome segregation protein SMC [Candidatus Marinimicrobia bacterium]|nr:chromosome segregation protein SMC [Candidatus Neomarinimicrobiota bacterium]